MSRFYKTAKAAPIVDYTVDYPFDDLFKASKYKNDLQDTRQEKLNQAYDDVLGLNYIPGATDENGVYTPSPSELYVKQKREQADELINKYANVDLTKTLKEVSKLDPVARDFFYNALPTALQGMIDDGQSFGVYAFATYKDWCSSRTYSWC